MTIMANSSSHWEKRGIEAGGLPGPDLSDHEIHVWRIFLPDLISRKKNLERFLDQKEKDRAARYSFDRDQQRFVVRRGAQRQILAAYLGVPADVIRYSTGKTGKPALPDRLDLHFSASFSGDWYVLALTRQAPVGVDIELNLAQPALNALAADSFSIQEQAFLEKQQGAHWLSAFYHIWCCKEAVLKAAGTGLIDDLHCIDVSPDPAEPAALASIQTAEIPDADWQMASFTLCQNGTGALAWTGGPAELRFFQAG